MRGYDIDFSRSTVIFENCIQTDNGALTSLYTGAADTFCGTKATDQLLYVYKVDAGILPYSVDSYPTVIIK